MAAGEAGPAARGELRSLLAAIVESSVDAIISKTLDGVITTWNTGAEHIYGYSADEIIGHNISEIVPPERSDELPPILALMRRGKAIGSFETKGRRKDGTIIDVSIAISPIRDAAGTVVGAASVARDVTERNRAETARLATEKQLQQAQRMETVGQLAGGIAHDFNNLLSTMMGFTSFVAEATTQQPELHADVEQIQEAVQRATTLVRQLLLFSRQTPARPAEVDITAIIDDAGDLLAASVREVDLQFQLGKSLPLVLADRGQLEQVVFNLAVNARDAMPHGGTLTISTGETEITDEDVFRDHDLRHHDLSPGHYVELTVSDTGTGMSAYVAARIFEPFFTTKPTGKGTGLGLATLHGIVTEAGGAIIVDTELGRGTTFRILFPALHATPASTPDARPPAAVRGNGETILVVDDEPSVLAVTARMLREHGYTVHAAASCQEALTAASDHDCQLLLTDTVLPDITGPALATRILQIRPGIAVIHMSGYTFGQLNEDAAEPDFIQKPFTAQALTNKVSAMLNATTGYDARELAPIRPSWPADPAHRDLLTQPPETPLARQTLPTRPTLLPVP